MVVLGIGRNQTYEALQQGKIKGAFRIGRRWLIPDAVIDRLMSGETAA
jgi:excisionase family DNA binding protein